MNKVIRLSRMEAQPLMGRPNTLRYKKFGTQDLNNDPFGGVEGLPMPREANWEPLVTPDSMDTTDDGISTLTPNGYYSNFEPKVVNSTTPKVEYRQANKIVNRSKPLKPAVLFPDVQEVAIGLRQRKKGTIVNAKRNQGSREIVYLV